MANKLIGTVMTVVVGVILIGSLLSVAISDYSTSEITITNEGMPYSEVGGDHTIIVDSSGIKVDGESVDVSLFPGSFTSYTLVYGSTSFVRWNADTNVLIAGVGLTPHQIAISDNTITIALSDSSVSISNTNSADVYTADDALFYISPSGDDYTLSLNPYASDDDVVYGAGDTYYTTSAGIPSNLRVWVVWTGVLDTITIKGAGIYGTSYSNIVVSDEVATLTNVQTNLYKYDSVVLDYTVTDNSNVDYSLESTYTYFLAPTTVYYDNPDYIGDSYVGLFGAIMVMAIVSLLVVALGMIRSRND